MNDNRRPIIGVVTARASESEQRQVLSGILSQAQILGADVVVLTNIYNFAEYHAYVEIENKIYELIASERIDGFILTAESIMTPELKQSLYEKLSRRSDIPVIVTGAEFYDFLCVNSDIRSDFEDIARHLTEVHGFTEIDVLTGHNHLATSHERLDGCRRVFEEKGIPFGDDNIIFGNYWTTSGEELAMEYISGKRRLPQAIICANDYMAYGLCDTFFENGIAIPETVTVVGYEYIGNRFYHSPILTTYQRNRQAAGAKAVSILYSMITGSEPQEIPLSGYMVCGDSCSCGVDRKYLRSELNTVRREQFYTSLNICGNFEQQMTVCRSISDYIKVLQEFSYLVRDVAGIYLCLYENWCSSDIKTNLSVDSNDETMVCYRVISPENGSDEPKFFTRHQLFPDELSGSRERAFLYFAPMFSEGHELGYFILQYKKPDGFDTIFLDWIKIAVNALLVLRMKNDIHELLACRNLSEFHDSVSNIYNKNGIFNDLQFALKNPPAEASLMLILIRTGLFFDDSHIDNQEISVRIDMELSECLKKLATDKNEFCAKLSDKLYAFAAIGSFNEENGKIYADKLNTLFTHSPLYIEHCGIDTTVAVSSVLPPDNIDLEAEILRMTTEINDKIHVLSEMRQHAQFRKYLNMRNAMYLNPQNNWDAQIICRDFNLSYGHFRAAYKEIFSVSFHQDLIQSRISMAKYLLMTSTLNLSTIADKCGYEDDKYFIRQFKQLTGHTPNKYRNIKI